MSSTSRPALRRSCHFCRARKIRCSGERICDMCRSKNRDCVYDGETSRVRTKSDTNVSRSSSPATSSHQSAGTAPTERRSSGSQHHHTHGLEIGRELEEIFNTSFSQIALPCEVNLFQSASSNHFEPSIGARNDRRKVGFRRINFSSLVKSFVGLIGTKFASLGSQHVDDGGATLCVRGFATDTTATMWDKSRSMDNPLLGFDGRKSAQLIDLWFSVHPLSVILSKTMLLRELRTQTLDPILHAIILGDVLAIQDDEISIAQGQALFQWATKQAKHRPSDADLKISTLQFLVLIAWHEACHGSFRRGIACLIYAGRRIATFKMSPEANEDRTTHSRINGVAVNEVEEEIMLNIQWAVFSLILWCHMQIDRPIAPMLQNWMPTKLPPVDETFSILYSLDQGSENISTLPWQKNSIRAMRPLSRVASIASHFYHSKEADPRSMSLQHLRMSADKSSGKDMFLACIQIRRAVSDAINAAGEQSHSQPLIQAIHHAILIHMLFPRSPPPNGTNPEPLESKLATLISSGQALLEIFEKNLSDAGPRGATWEVNWLALPEIYVAGIDAYARAMIQLLSNAHCEGIPAHLSRLAELAGIMIDTLKVERTLAVKAARRVKKCLKAGRKLFLQQSQVAFANHDFGDLSALWNGVANSDMNGMASVNTHNNGGNGFTTLDLVGHDFNFEGSMDMQGQTLSLPITPFQHLDLDLANPNDYVLFPSLTKETSSASFGNMSNNQCMTPPQQALGTWPHITGGEWTVDLPFEFSTTGPDGFNGSIAPSDLSSEYDYRRMSNASANEHAQPKKEARYGVKRSRTALDEFDPMDMPRRQSAMSMVMGA